MARGLSSGLLRLDVRSEAAFRELRLIGSSNIPCAELQRRTGELPPAGSCDGGLTVVVADQRQAEAALAVLQPSEGRGWSVREVVEATPEYLERARNAGDTESGGTVSDDAVLWRPSPHLMSGGAALGALEEDAHTFAQCCHLRALDLGCGKGRDAVYLAMRGWAVDGVDNQKCFLDAMRDFADRKGVGHRIKPYDADMCSLQPGELAARYADVLPEVLLHEESMSIDGRPVVSYVARKPRLLTIRFTDDAKVVVRIRAS